MFMRSYTSVNNGCVATGFVSPTRFVTLTSFVSPIRSVTPTRFVTRLVCCDAFCQSGDRDRRPFNKELNICTQLWQSDYDWQRQVCCCIRNASGLLCYDYTDRKTPRYVVCSLCVDRSITALPSWLLSGEVPCPQWIPKVGSFCVSLWWVYCTVL